MTATSPTPAQKYRHGESAGYKRAQDEIREILDRAMALHKGDKWAILQIIRLLRWQYKP